MNHTQKIKLARKLRTPDEEKRGVPLFLTTGWGKRSAAIVARVKKQQGEAHKRAVARKEAAKKLKQK